MLLQTNSYIVPKEKRSEHTRMMRRFRQALGKLGCDMFEVYEQVGANWTAGDNSGRYVQIMRFRDRKHQMAVQNAERNDPVAQALIAEFCELVNFQYQQQQGFFAVGFYNSVLQMSPMQAASADDESTDDMDEAPIGAGMPEAHEVEPEAVEHADAAEHPTEQHGEQPAEEAIESTTHEPPIDLIEGEVTAVASDSLAGETEELTEALPVEIAHQPEPHSTGIEEPHLSEEELLGELSGSHEPSTDLDFGSLDMEDTAVGEVVVKSPAADSHPGEVGPLEVEPADEHQAEAMQELLTEETEGHAHPHDANAPETPASENGDTSKRRSFFRRSPRR